MTSRERVLVFKLKLSWINVVRHTHTHSDQLLWEEDYLYLLRGLSVIHPLSYLCYVPCSSCCWGGGVLVWFRMKYRKFVNSSGKWWFRSTSWWIILVLSVTDADASSNILSIIMYSSIIYCCTICDLLCPLQGCNFATKGTTIFKFLRLSAILLIDIFFHIYLSPL